MRKMSKIILKTIGEISQDNAAKRKLLECVGSVCVRDRTYLAE